MELTNTGAPWQSVLTNVRAGANISRVEQEFQAAPGTAAIDRGAELLLRVLESPEPVALTDVAAAAGIPKSRAPAPDWMREELETVRRLRFATAIDALEPGLAAIAVPVAGAHGDVIAALSITGPTLRMTPERIAELKPALMDEARRLAGRLSNR